MTEPKRLRAAVRWTLLTFMVLAGCGMIWFQFVGPRPTNEVVLAGVGFLASAAVGALIVVRRDGHPTGWFLLVIGLTILFVDGAAFLPGLSDTVAAWIGSWGWTAVFALFAGLTLTFPAGRLPDGSGFWQRAGRLSARVLPALVFVAATTKSLGGPEASSSTPNPIGIFPDWMSFPALLTVAAILLGGVISLVVKRRRAPAVERAQITWVVFAFVLLITSIVFTFLYIFGSMALGAGDPGDAPWLVAFMMMLLFPMSFGVAVLRYRLYDIDRIVSRTVAYALVAGLIAILYGAVVLLVGLLPFERPVQVAVSTLAVAAAFNSLRRRVQAAVDRRFNRSQYDAQQVMAKFTGSLQLRVDQDRIVSEWVDVVSQTMQPTVVGVWLTRGTA